MGKEIKLDFSPYHKVSYNGKFAAAVRANGNSTAGWKEHTTPTGMDWPASTGLKTYLPLVSHNSDQAKNTNCTYDYRQNLWWKNGRANKNVHNPTVRSGGIGCPLTNLPSGSNMALAGEQKAFIFKKSYNMLTFLLFRWGRGASAYGTSAANANMVPGKQYTMSFWAYISSAAMTNTEEHSRFEFGIAGHSSYYGKPGPGSGTSYDLAYYGVGQHKLILDCWPRVHGGIGQPILRMEAGGTNSWLSTTSHSIQYSSKYIPLNRWNHISVGVSSGHYTVGSNAKQVSTLGSGYSRGDDWGTGGMAISSGYKYSGGANATDFVQYSNVPYTAFYKSYGRAIRISDFRLYGRYLNPLQREVSHIRNHRNQFGDLPTNKRYPSPEGELTGEPTNIPLGQEEVDPPQGPDFSLFTSDLMGRMEHDGVKATDIHQVTEDFDKVHGSSHLDTMLKFPVSHLEELEATSPSDMGAQDVGDLASADEISEQMGE